MKEKTKQLMTKLCRALSFASDSEVPQAQGTEAGGDQGGRKQTKEHEGGAVPYLGAAPMPNVKGQLRPGESVF